MAHPTLSPEMGIHVRYFPYHAQWVGTRAQLESEGVVPADFKWPAGRRGDKFETASNWFFLERYKYDGAEPTDETLYRLRIYDHTVDFRERAAKQKLREAQEILAIRTPEGARMHAAWLNTLYDRDFQAFKRNLLGLKKRGRKPATTTPKGENV